MTVAGLATVFTDKGVEEGLDINGYLNTVSLTPNLDGSVSESVGHADPRNGNFSMFNINFKPSKLEIEVSIVAASATLLWPILGPELAPFLGEEGATIFEKLLPKLIKLPPPI